MHRALASQLDMSSGSLRIMKVLLAGIVLPPLSPLIKSVLAILAIHPFVSTRALHVIRGCFEFAKLNLQMVFVLDNYDSFTYNLVQYLGELGETVEVRRNDQITCEEIERLNPDHILISPGPCTPQMAGISIELIKHFAGKKPVLGVCLGHQAIGAAFGGDVVRARKVMHGKVSQIEHDGRTIFRSAPTPMTATRYHSLIVSEKNLPSEL